MPQLEKPRAWFVLAALASFTAACGGETEEASQLNNEADEDADTNSEQADNSEQTGNESEATDEEDSEAEPDPAADGPSYEATVAPIFQAKCTASCHEPGGLLGGPGGIDPVVKMDLESESAYSTLISQNSAQLPSMALVGTSLETSYLWHKLNDSQLSVGGEGARMPLTGTFSAEDLAAVRAWIEGDAAP